MASLNLYSDSYLDATVISNRFFDDYMKDANDAQLKVYLYLLRIMSAGRTTSISEIADKFNHTEKDVIRALKYWEKVNLLTLDYDEQRNIIGIHLQDLRKPATTSAGATIVPIQPKLYSVKQQYTASQLEQFASDEEFCQIRFVAETYLGRLLSESDLRSLLFIYHDLKLTPELMDYLIEYCVSKDKKDMKYIERVALDWAESEIKTVRQAKLRQGKHDKLVYTVMKALGKASVPTDTEVAYIRKWTQEYGFSQSIIGYACEKTVLAVDSHRIEYADAILSSWFTDGYKTKEQIDAGEQKYRQEKKAVVKQPASAGSRFHDFKQNSYDFASLEKQIISN
ncbi:MAG: DnaD domain protein [Lachnospiraceae bacterium]|nr:DnaD domain protein [Lachnospiraceae bacterium]